MIIAIPTKNGEVFQHFGQSTEFTLFDIEDHIVKNSTTVDTSDSGHGALAARLKEHNVTMLICGGVGAGAIDALAQSNIEVLPGVAGNAKEALTKYLSGEKIGNPSFRCNHHEEGHTCHH